MIRWLLEKMGMLDARRQCVMCNRALSFDEPYLCERCSRDLDR